MNKRRASLSVFPGVSEYRSSVDSFSYEKRYEIELEDGSGLLGTTCDSESSCKAVLYRQRIDNESSCPLGTEMVYTASGTVGNTVYVIKPSPRVRLVGEMPSTCQFIDDSYHCQSGEVTLRFSRVEEAAFCDNSSDEDCPFPVVGRPYGACDALLPCTTGLN